MRAVDLLKPLAVFVLVIVVVLAGTALVGVTTRGSGPSPDGRTVDGQSPDGWQPDSVLVESDSEEGTLEVDANTEDKRILVDTRHSNDFSRSDLEPLVDALFRNDHEVTFTPSTESEFGEPSYNETLQKFDAVLVIAPTESFTDEEVGGLEAFARGGGRVVVLNEPTQNSLESSGLFGSNVVSRQYAGNDFTEEFGMRVGDGILYNMDDERNDNNFKSIHAVASGSGALAGGVDRVTFDTAGRIVTTDDADGLVTAAEGTALVETRRTGEYTVAARNENVVLVADASFVEESEVYDLDNERFVSNLLTFMVTGDKPDDVPETGDDDDGFGDDTPPTPEPPSEDEPTPPPRTTVAG